MKTELIIQELETARKALSNAFHDNSTNMHSLNSPQFISALSRLRFCIASLKAKEADTVRLVKS